MQFMFNGTLEEFKETIQTKAQELKKDIIIYHNEPDTLEIGFQRLGHSGGRFFMAKVTEAENNVVLNGEIVDVYSGKQETKVQASLSLLSGLALFYVLIEMILQIVWLPIFRFSYIWIPLLLPIPIIIFCRRNAKKQEKVIDTEFVSFMSSFTSKYCSYLRQYIDEGCCYDLQMILDGYIKESVLPGVIIDKRELSDHCSKCKNR